MIYSFRQVFLRSMDCGVTKIDGLCLRLYNFIQIQPHPKPLELHFVQLYQNRIYKTFSQSDTWNVIFF